MHYSDYLREQGPNIGGLAMWRKTPPSKKTFSNRQRFVRRLSLPQTQYG